MLFRGFYGYGLVFALVLVGCHLRATPLTRPANEILSSQSATAQAENEGQSASPTEATVEEKTALGEEIPLPSQETVLVAKDPNAHINIRASPNTGAAIVGAGFVSDPVTVSRLSKAEDGDDWYYIQLDAERSGWVREDFVDAVNLPTAPTFVQDGGETDVLSPVLDNHCGGPRGIAAYYRTASFVTYICSSRDRLIYIGHEVGTSQVLVTEQVKSLPGRDLGYVAHHDNYEYHISETELLVYRMDNREELIEILTERVTIAEHY